MTRKKTHSHLRAVKACTEARTALLHVGKLLEASRTDEGERLTEEQLRDKAGTARAWLGKAQAEIANVAANLDKEIAYREHEADPEQIHHRQFQEEVRRLQRLPKRRRKADELTPDVLRLRDEGLMAAAIADVLHASDTTVKRILKEATA